MKKTFYLALLGLLLLNCSTKKVFTNQETKSTKTEVTDQSLLVKTDSLKTIDNSVTKTENKDTLVEIQNQFTPIDITKPLEITDPSGKKWHIKNGAFNSIIKNKKSIATTQTNTHKTTTAGTKITVQKKQNSKTAIYENENQKEIEKKGTSFWFNAFLAFGVILLLIWVFFDIIKK